MINYSQYNAKFEYFEAICKSGNIDDIKAAIEDGRFNSDAGLAGACAEGHIEVIHLIIEHSSKLNEFVSLGFGLHCACFYNQREVIDLMIELGVNDFDGGLVSAGESGHVNIMRRMMECGADDLNRGLRGACKGGNMKAIQLMIDCGAENYRRGLRGARVGGHQTAIDFMVKLCEEKSESN